MTKDIEWGRCRHLSGDINILNKTTWRWDREFVKRQGSLGVEKRMTSERKIKWILKKEKRTVSNSQVISFGQSWNQNRQQRCLPTWFSFFPPLLFKFSFHFFFLSFLFFFSFTFWKHFDFFRYLPSGFSFLISFFSFFNSFLIFFSFSSFLSTIFLFKLFFLFLLS